MIIKEKKLSVVKNFKKKLSLDWVYPLHTTVRSKELFAESVLGKIFGTISSFYVKAHYGKGSISGFQEFFASIHKIFVLRIKLDTRL